MWIQFSKYKKRFPSLHKNYGKPRFERSGKRWSQPKMIEFIKSKPHWDAYDFKYELRITIDHSRYLILLSKIK